MIGIDRSQEGVEHAKKAISIALVDFVETDRNHAREDGVFSLGGA
jgi:hypothetical protein